LRKKNGEKKYNNIKKMDKEFASAFDCFLFTITFVHVENLFNYL